MAKAKTETDPAVLAAFDAMIASIPGLERKGAAMPYVSVNGHMVAMINKSDVIGLHLSKDDLARFLATFGNSPFEGAPGFVNKEYAAAPAALRPCSGNCTGPMYGSSLPKPPRARSSVSAPCVGPG